MQTKIEQFVIRQYDFKNTFERFMMEFELCYFNQIGKFPVIYAFDFFILVKLTEIATKEYDDLNGGKD